MATAAPAFNSATLVDPSLYGDQQALAQQQQLAAMLMEGGMSPVGGTQMAGNVAIRNSPTESIAKLVQLLSGQDIQRQVNQGNQLLGQRQFAANMQNVGGYGAPGQGQDPRGGGNFPRLGGDTTGYMTAMLLGSDPSKYAELATGQNAPTDLDKQLYAQGIYPGSPQWASAHGDAQFKANNVPPTEVRPDQIAYSPRTGDVVANNPKAPAGYTNTYAPGSGVATGQAPVQGGLPAITASQAAEHANDVVDVPQSDGSVQKMTKTQFLAKVGGGNTPYKFDVQPGSEGLMRDALVKAGDPAALAAFDAKYNGPGINTGQTTAGREAQGKTAEAVTGRNQSVIADANAAPQDIENLTKMGQLAGTANFGPGASTAAKWQAIASQLPGIGLIVNPKTLQENQTNVTLMKKYLSDMAGRNSGGTDTDARLQNKIDSLPNDTAPDAAIKEIVPLLIARRTARMDEGNIRQSLGSNTDAISKFETDWRSAYKSEAYEASIATRGMSAPQALQWVKQHYDPAQAREIMQSRKALLDLGARFGQ